MIPFASSPHRTIPSSGWLFYSLSTFSHTSSNPTTTTKHHQTRHLTHSGAPAPKNPFPMAERIKEDFMSFEQGPNENYVDFKERMISYFSEITGTAAYQVSSHIDRSIISSRDS